MALRVGSLLCLLLATSFQQTVVASSDSQDVVYVERQGLMEVMEVIRREAQPMSPAELPNLDLSRRATNATAKAPVSNQTEALDLAKISSAVSVAAAAGRTTSPSSSRSSTTSSSASIAVKLSSSSSVASRNSTSSRARVASAVRPAITSNTNGTASALRQIHASNSTTSMKSTHAPAIVVGNTTTITLATSIVKPLATGNAPFLNLTSTASTSRNVTRQQSGNVRAGAPQEAPATVRPVSISTQRAANLTAPAASAVRQPIFPGLEGPATSISVLSSTTTSRITRTVTRTPSPFTRTVISDTTVDFTKTVVVEQTVAVAPVALSHLSALGLSSPPSTKSTPSVVRIGDHGSASAKSSVATSSSKSSSTPTVSPGAAVPVAIVPAPQAASQKPAMPIAQSPSPAVQQAPPSVNTAPAAPIVPAVQPAASNVRAGSPNAPPVAIAPPAVSAPLTIRTSSIGEKPRATITIAAGNGGNSLVAVPSPAPARPTQAADSCNCACKCPAGMFQLQSVINNAGPMASKPSQAPAAPKVEMSTLLTSAIRSSATPVSLASSKIITEIKQSMTTSSTTRTSLTMSPSLSIKASLVSLSSVIKPTSLSMLASIARLASDDNMDEVVSTVFAASLNKATPTSSSSPKLTVGGSVVPLASAVTEPLIVNGHLINLPDQEGLHN